MIFDYVSFDDECQKIQADCKAAFQNVDDIIKRNFKGTTNRELSLAMTKLEEAYMWIGKSVKRIQLEKENYPKHEVM